MVYFDTPYRGTGAGVICKREPFFEIPVFDPSAMV